MIDLNNHTMELKKIEATTSLRVLPTGHVAHNLTEFAPGGRKVPTREQTKLFQARTGDFRKDDSTRSQISQVVSHIQPPLTLTCLCAATYVLVIVELMTKRPLTTLLVMYKLKNPSTSECSFASGFDVDANSSMGKSSAGSRGPVAKTCRAVPCPRDPSSLASRYGLVAENVFQ